MIPLIGIIWDPRRHNQRRTTFRYTTRIESSVVLLAGLNIPLKIKNFEELLGCVSVKSKTKDVGKNGFRKYVKRLAEKLVFAVTNS